MDIAGELQAKGVPPGRLEILQDQEAFIVRNVDNSKGLSNGVRITILGLSKSGKGLHVHLTDDPSQSFWLFMMPFGIDFAGFKLIR